MVSDISKALGVAEVSAFWTYILYLISSLCSLMHISFLVIPLLWSMMEWLLPLILSTLVSEGFVLLDTFSPLNK